MVKAMRRFGPTMAVLGLMIGSATPTRADVVIDQQNTTNSTFTVTALPALGQSFTPTLNSIDFATFILSNTNPSTYKVQVFSGVGFGGTLLGESLTQAVALAPLPPSGQPFTVDNAQPVEFDFTAPIALTPGNAYTLKVVQVSGAGGFFFTRTGLNNPYPGGTAFDVAPINNIDFVFGEGIHTAAVPEPSSLALFGIAGLAVLGYTRVRRRPAA